MKALQPQTLEAVAPVLAKMICETVAAAGAQGAPSGSLYAALLSIGMDLETYGALMASLESSGRLRRQGQVYFIGPKGR